MLISRASKPAQHGSGGGSEQGTSDKAEAPKPHVTGSSCYQNHHGSGGDVQECEDLGETVIDSMDSVHAGREYLSARRRARRYFRPVNLVRKIPHEETTVTFDNGFLNAPKPPYGYRFCFNQDFLYDLPGRDKAGPQCKGFALLPRSVLLSLPLRPLNLPDRTVPATIKGFLATPRRLRSAGDLRGAGGSRR